MSQDYLQFVLPQWCLNQLRYKAVDKNYICWSFLLIAFSGHKSSRDERLFVFIVSSEILTGFFSFFANLLFPLGSEWELLLVS